MKAPKSMHVSPRWLLAVLLFCAAAFGLSVGVLLPKPVGRQTAVVTHISDIPNFDGRTLKRISYVTFPDRHAHDLLCDPEHLEDTVLRLRGDK